MPFAQLVSVVYWLGLAAWFGGALVLALAPPVVMRAVGEAKPILPGVLSVNLEGQHSTLLGGSILLRLFAAVRRAQLVGAGATLVGLLAQWAGDLGGGGDAVVGLLVRTVLFLAAAGLLAWEALHVWPRVERHRAAYVEHADEVERANAELDRFERYTAEALATLRWGLFVLVGLVATSASLLTRPGFVVPRAAETPAGEPRP